MQVIPAVPKAAPILYELKPKRPKVKLMAAVLLCAKFKSFRISNLVS